MPASRTPKLLQRTLSATSSISNVAASPSKVAPSPQDGSDPSAASASSSSPSKPVSTFKFKPPPSAIRRPPPPAKAPAATSSKLKQATLPFVSTVPKPAAAPPPPASPEAVAAFERLFPTLERAQLPLLELELETMGGDWLEVMKDEMATPGFLQLKSFLQKECKSAKVFPPQEDIYSFTRLSKINDVKVVIIGQDPYHQPGQAHGLSFSVRKGVQVPPSLRNIYKEIKIEYPDLVIPKHGDLTSLASQGVLLLNTSLTVRASSAGSHAKAGWEPFTRALLRHLGQPSSTADGKGKVFFVWGKHAEKALEGAGVDEKKNLVLRSVHPSPLSASRGFFETGHFKQADEWLKTTWGEGGGVDWTRAGSN